ncbi:MAG: glycosyltransferase [Bacteroidales bacterium]|nr:glycosyltransferase [Bacteroidales bacterium]
MKLSVIIPAFNAERTLAACVESVFSALDGCSFELILVDDGSTDGTLALAESLAGAGARGGRGEAGAAVRVLHQENGGVSSARNLGLDHAAGDWVAFVDADDTLDPACGPSLCSILADAAPSCDILILRSFTGGKERYPWAGLFADGALASREGLMRKGYLRGSVCGCIFRRNFLSANGLHFPEGVRLSEDSVFFAACLGEAQRIRFCDIPFYRIGVFEGSASHSFREDDPEQLARAMYALEAGVADAPVRNYALFKLMIVLASRSAAAGIPAGEIYRRCGLARRLPLALDGIYAERPKIRILNLSFGLFRFLIKLRDSLC